MKTIKAEEIRKWVVPFTFAGIGLLIAVLVVGSFMNSYHTVKNKNSDLERRVEALESMKIISLTAMKIREIHLTTLAILREGKPKLSPIISQDIALAITESHVTYAHSGITKELILGLMEVESNFNTQAVSSVGALGLMQVMKATAYPYLKYMLKLKDELLDLETSLKRVRLNVLVGTAVLDDYYSIAEQRFSKTLNPHQIMAVALIIYNRGEGSLNGWINRVGGIKNVLKESKYDKSVFAKKSEWDKLNRMAVLTK